MLLRYAMLVAAVFAGDMAVVCAAESHATPIERTGAESSRQVVVERLDFEGNPSTSKGFLNAAIDIPLGRPLSRLELDQRLADAQQRLEAYGYFKSVDLRLVRGSKRDHFVVVARLEAKSDYYIGTSGSYHEERDGNRPYGPPVRHRTNHYSLFAGTRDLGGTGIQLDVETAHERERTTNAYEGDGDKGRRQTSNLYLLKPDLGGTPYYAGLYLMYSDEQSDRNSGSGSYQSSSEDNSYFGGALGLLGMRVGLYKIGVGVMRYGGAYRSENSFAYDGNLSQSKYSLKFFYTFFMAQAGYSEKSDLAVIEPGLSVALNYQRVTAQKWGEPTLSGLVNRTFVVNGRHALTPGAIASFSKEDRGDEVVVVKQYDVSAIYEYATPWDWVLGIEEGRVGMLNEDEPHTGRYPAVRTRLKARYVTASLLMDLSFVYGAEGLQSMAYLPGSGGRVQP